MNIEKLLYIYAVGFLGFTSSYAVDFLTLFCFLDSLILMFGCAKNMDVMSGYVLPFSKPSINWC